MKFRIVSIVFASLVIVGCGGSGAGGSGGAGGAGGSGTISPSDINISQDILNGKISDYSSADPIKNQYLSVVNHLRRQKIKCNDNSAKTGPSPELESNALLERAAKEHSDDYSASGRYNRDHFGSGTASDLTSVAWNLNGGSTPQQRVEYNGYDGISGDNQAMLMSYYAKGRKPANFEAVQDNTWIYVMQGWMKSRTGHCSNIMNASFEDFGMHESGVRIEDNGTHILHTTYWTQEFGKSNQ